MGLIWFTYGLHMVSIWFKYGFKPLKKRYEENRFKYEGERGVTH